MSAVVEAPINLIESVADLRFPPKADARLQGLMDRNTNGQLSPDEKAELEAWVEVSENLATVRGEALRLLGSSPADLPPRVFISPLAYLWAMWNLWWSAVRHPLSETTIDLSTGRVLSRV